MPNGLTVGEVMSAIAPAASRMRNSVGPTPKNAILNTPRAWVARYVSADTRKNAATTSVAIIADIWPDAASPANSSAVPARSMT
jgi:hypothetical protein